MVAIARTVRPFAFMAMPLGSEELDAVYGCFVRPGLTDRCDLECLRADDLDGSAVIVGEVREAIARAAIVVADVTGTNPNVLYEIGLADGMGTPVLLIAQKLGDVPFDLSARRILVYTYSPAGCRALEVAVARGVRAILGNCGGGGRANREAS
jgi:hypothetical protein